MRRSEDTLGLRRPAVPGVAMSSLCLAFLTPALAGLALSGCSGDASSAEEVRRAVVAPASEAGESEVLAEVAGDDITLADVRDRVGDELDRLTIAYRQERSALVGTTLDQILFERVLEAEAEDQNVTVEELIAAEAGGSFDPTDDEVESWYGQNQARLQGRTLAQVRGQIVDFLRRQKRFEAVQGIMARHRRDHGVAVHFEPYRVPLANDGAPAWGPADAEVTVTEFSDFQCPFCSRFAATVDRLKEEFDGRIRVVFRQFPLDNIHPEARKAAEASLCADEQDRFWELHDLMFREQQRLSVADLKDKAERVGLDREAFDECLDTGRYTERVQEDLREARRLGLNGTPAVFIDGIRLEGGAVTYEVAAAAIEEALRDDGR